MYNYGQIDEEREMKMGFLFSGIFWGVILILLGLAMIIKVVFNVSLPIFRIVFAIIFVYIGFKILVGGFGGGIKTEKNDVVFGETIIEAKGSDERAGSCPVEARMFLRRQSPRSSARFVVKLPARTTDPVRKAGFVLALLGVEDSRTRRAAGRGTTARARGLLWPG